MATEFPSGDPIIRDLEYRAGFAMEEYHGKCANPKCGREWTETRERGNKKSYCSVACRSAHYKAKKVVK